MKRSVGGGATRGPVARSRQRRTIRLMQVLLVVIAAGLLMFAGYSLGQVDGYEDARRAEEVGPPRPPAAGQTIALAALGLVALGGAWLLGGRGEVRIPTPARLDELAGRAESTALDRAEKAAARSSHPSSGSRHL